MIRPLGSYWISNWLKWRRETRSAKRHLAPRVAFTSQLNKLLIFRFYQADCRETPAPQKLARRYCYKLNEGTDACFVRGNTTSTEPTTRENSTEPKPTENVSEQNPLETSTEPKPSDISTEAPPTEASTDPRLENDYWGKWVFMFTFLIDSWLDTWWPFFSNWTVRY